MEQAQNTKLQTDESSSSSPSSGSDDDLYTGMPQLAFDMRPQTSSSELDLFEEILNQQLATSSTAAAAGNQQTEVNIVGGDFCGAQIVGSQTTHQHFNLTKKEFIDKRQIHHTINVHQHQPHLQPPASQQQDQSSQHDYIQLSDSIRMFHREEIKQNVNVFRGERTSTITGSLPLAIKSLNFNENNKKEAHILTKVRPHKNVVSIIHSDVYHQGPVPYIYIAMELCHTKNLHDHVTENKNNNVPFDSQLSISQAKQLVEGLNHIHSNKIIHRDLKPQNVLFSLDKKSLKIADFGISKPMTSGLSKTKVTNVGAGTDGYRVPESFNSSNKISQKADIYSMGLVLYFLWSNGNHAFGDDPDDWNSNIKKDKNRDLSALQVEDRDKATDLLQWMLQFEPGKRPTTAQILNHRFFGGSLVSPGAETSSPAPATSLTSGARRKLRTPSKLDLERSLSKSQEETSSSDDMADNECIKKMKPVSDSTSSEPSTSGTTRSEFPNPPRKRYSPPPYKKSRPSLSTENEPKFTVVNASKKSSVGSGLNESLHNPTTTYSSPPPRDELPKRHLKLPDKLTDDKAELLKNMRSLFKDDLIPEHETLTLEIDRYLKRNEDVGKNVNDDPNALIKQQQEITKHALDVKQSKKESLQKDPDVALQAFTVSPEGGVIELDDYTVTFPEGAFDGIATVWAAEDVDSSKWPQHYFGIGPMLYLICSRKILKPLKIEVGTWCVSDGSDEGNQTEVEILHKPVGATTWNTIANFPLSDNPLIEFECQSFSPVLVAIQDRDIGRANYLFSGFLYVKGNHEFHSGFFFYSKNSENNMKQKLENLNGKLKLIYNNMILKRGDNFHLKLDSGQEDFVFHPADGSGFPVTSTFIQTLKEKILYMTLQKSSPSCDCNLPVTAEIRIDDELQDSYAFNHEWRAEKFLMLEVDPLPSPTPEPKPLSESPSRSTPTSSSSTVPRKEFPNRRLKPTNSISSEPSTSGTSHSHGKLTPPFSFFSVPSSTSDGTLKNASKKDRNSETTASGIIEADSVPCDEDRNYVPADEEIVNEKKMMKSLIPQNDDENDIAHTPLNNLQVRPSTLQPSSPGKLPKQNVSSDSACFSEDSEYRGPALEKTFDYSDKVLEGDELVAVANKILQSSEEIPHAKFSGVQPNNENVKLFAECLRRCKTVEIETLHVQDIIDIEDEFFPFLEEIVKRGNVKSSFPLNDDCVDIVVQEITPGGGGTIRIRHCVITFPRGAVSKNTTFILRHLVDPKIKVILIGFTRITPAITCTPSMTFNDAVHFLFKTRPELAHGEHDTCSVFATVLSNEGNQKLKTERIHEKPIENDHIQFSLRRFDVVCGGVDDKIKDKDATIVTYFLCTDDERNFVSVCCLNNNELIKKLKDYWIESGYKIIFAATDVIKVRFDTELSFQLTCGQASFKFDSDKAKYVSINKHFQEKKSDTVAFTLIVPTDQTLPKIVEFNYKVGDKDHPKLIKLPVTIEKDERNGQKYTNIIVNDQVTAKNFLQDSSTMNSTEKNGITYTSSSLPKVPNHGTPV